jgi:hypothetical protein
LSAIPDAVADMIEPDAKDMVGVDGASDELVALASIAISLRRIADALGGDGGPFVNNLYSALDNASHNHWQRMQS